MPGLFIAFSPRLIESWGGAHIEIVKLLLHFPHFECGGEGSAILVLLKACLLNNTLQHGCDCPA